MRYKVYQNGQLCKVMAKKNNSSMRYKVYMFKVTKPSKHREEIEEYLENMNEPILTVQNNIATLTFDPIPEQMATWIVQSKTTFFNVVRLSGGGAHHMNSRYNKASRQTVKNTFTYPVDDWKVRGHYSNVSIPNTLNDRSNRILSINELVSGSITRNVSYLHNFITTGCNSGDIREIMFNDGGWYKQFYIGLIYFNEGNIPSIYKMGKHDIIVEN